MLPAASMHAVTTWAAVTACVVHKFDSCALQQQQLHAYDWFGDGAVQQRRVSSPPIPAAVVVERLLVTPSGLQGSRHCH